jgi:cation transport regulator ChaC
MKYFAYGSNMLSSRLRAPSRAPTAIPLGLGLLPDYDLRFQKRSDDGSSKCTIVPCAGRQVFGVVFDVASAEKAQLDQAEGLGDGYAEEYLMVSREGGPLRVLTYVAQSDHIKPDLAPYTWYRDIVVAGARDHRLPETYVQFLLATDATEDPDRERDRRNQRVLASHR